MPARMVYDKDKLKYNFIDLDIDSLVNEVEEKVGVRVSGYSDNYDRLELIFSSDLSQGQIACLDEVMERVGFDLV